MRRFLTLLKGLSDRGHNITVLSPDLDTSPPANVHYIYMEGVYDYLHNETNIDFVAMHKDNAIKNAANLYDYGIVSCLGNAYSLNCMA